MTFATLTFGENDETVLFTRAGGQSGGYPQPTPGRHVEEEAEYVGTVGPIAPFVAPPDPSAQQRVDGFRAPDNVLTAALETAGIEAGFADADAYWVAVRDAL